MDRDASSQVGKPQLARFTVADGLGTVVDREDLRGAGRLLLNPGKAAAIAAAQPSIKSWLGQYKDVSHTSDHGDDRVWTVTYYSGGNQVAEVHIPDATGVPKRTCGQGRRWAG